MNTATFGKIRVLCLTGRRLYLSHILGPFNSVLPTLTGSCSQGLLALTGSCSQRTWAEKVFPKFQHLQPEIL